jgi:plastocyanin
VIKAALAVAAGAALLGGSAAPGKKTVAVGDNYYAPKTLTVKRGTTVTWRWPGFEEAGDVHDVELKSGPKGVKKFHSESAATDYAFKRKLTVPGTYKLVCTLHHEMTMSVKVR